jgi:hypothetical protein
MTIRRSDTMKKIEAYQISDGRKYFSKEEAQRNEDKLRYRAQVKKVETYLYDLLGIEDKEVGEDGDGPEEQLYDMLVEERGISDLLGNALEDGAVIELIIDMATVLDGALLKATQYARRVTT